MKVYTVIFNDLFYVNIFGVYEDKEQAQNKCNSEDNPNWHVFESDYTKIQELDNVYVIYQYITNENPNVFICDTLQEAEDRIDYYNNMDGYVQCKKTKYYRKPIVSKNIIACFVNSEELPVKTEHICFYPKEKIVHGQIQVEVYEVVEEYYKHPQSPENCLIVQIKTRYIKTISHGKLYPAALILLKSQDNFANQLYDE